MATATNLQTLTWTLLRKTGPTSLPVAVADVKANLNLSPNNTVHDAKLAARIRAATSQLERDINQTVMTQTMVYATTQFMREMRLPTKPVQSITAIRYLDTEGAQQTVPSDDYRLDIGARVVYLAPGAAWPSVSRGRGAVEVEYVGGYGDEPRNVDDLIKQAVILAASKWFANPDQMANELITGEDKAYEAIVAKLLRSSYP